MPTRARLNLFLAAFLLLGVGVVGGLWLRGGPATRYVVSPASAGVEPRIDLRLDAVPLDHVLEDLARRGGRSLIVHWKLLETLGVARDTPVRIALGRVSLRQAVAAVLAVTDPTAKADFRDEGGVLTVSTADDLSLGGVLRIYNVRDIIKSWAAYFASENTDAPQTQPIGPIGGQVSQPDLSSREKATDELAKFIEDTIDAASWVDNGGPAGRLRTVAGLLIVVQTPDNHKKLAEFLDELRSGKGRHIHGSLPPINHSAR